MPIATNGVNYMAVNGRWLFGVANQDTDIESFSIAANGALKLKDTYNVTPPGPGVISVYLDHTGSTLYADFYTTNNDFVSFNINQSTGQLKEVRETKVTTASSETMCTPIRPVAITLDRRSLEYSAIRMEHSPI